MKKNIAKTLLTLCFALSVFMCGSSMASAAVSYPDATNHTHYFNVPTHIDTKTVDCGTHQYVWGYGSNSTPIYHYDCRVTQIIWIYDNQCANCQTFEGKPWNQPVFIKHSISHE